MLALIEVVRQAWNGAIVFIREQMCICSSQFKWAKGFVDWSNSRTYEYFVWCSLSRMASRLSYYCFKYEAR